MLPFLEVAELRRQNDTVLNPALPVSVWPANARAAMSGRVYDHEGECPESAYSTVNDANLHLLLNGTRYVIVDATLHPFLPHVALRLRETRTGG